MKKLLLGTAGLVALIAAAPAFAADLPARTYTKAPVMIDPIFNWSGFYMGANAGGGSSHDCWNVTNVLGTPIVPSVREGCSNGSGGLAGGQIGYRWQSANWVFGVEAQGDWANLSGSNVSSPAALTSVLTNKSRTDAFGLFTGQVGYSWNNVLGYVKGGAAVTDNKYNGSLTGSGIGVDSSSETRWGGTVGAGFEFAFAPNWSVGLEYDHLFMGSQNVGFTGPGFPTRNDNIHQDVDIGMARLNYRWGGAGVARY